MFGFLKKRRPASDFWSWFAAVAPRIRAKGCAALPEISDDVSIAFEKSYPDLSWEIIPSESCPWAFCVSAEGNHKLFDQVKSAVQDAPPVRGWEIVAFRQRGSLDAVIEFHGGKLSYDDIWCRVMPDGTRARVTLLIRGLAPSSAEVLLGAALILLDNAVGEYDSVAKISDLNNGPLPASSVRSQTLFPLAELPAYLDGLDDS